MYKGDPLRKAIKFMFNSPEILNSLSRVCSGKMGGVLDLEEEGIAGVVVGSQRRPPFILKESVVRYCMV